MHQRIGRHVRRRIAAAAAILLAATMTAVVGTGSPAVAATAFTSTVVNQGSGNCMDDPYSSTTSGTQLIQYSCNSGSNQSWTFTPVSGSSAYTIKSFAALCVDISGNSSADNAQVIQYTCGTQTNQQFTLAPVTVSGVTNTFNVVAVNSGKCIVPTGDTTASNTLLVQLPCTSALTRVWRLPSYSGGTASGNTVTVTNPGTLTGTVGTSVSKQFSATDSASGQTLTFTASALPAGLSISSAGLVTGTPTAAGTSTVVVTARDTTGATGSATFSWVINTASGTTTYLGIPGVVPNACNNSSLPNAYGTGFPTPSDPYGQGFSNETALGWDGNYWPVYQYISGAFFARGVPTTYNANGTNICGAMYAFSIYNYNGNRPAQSVQWTEQSGYLPAMTTSFTSGSVGVAIKEFANKVTIGGSPFDLVYTRVSVTDNGSAAVTIDPGGSGPNLLRLTSTSLNTVQPGTTSNHDYVVAVDNFGSGKALPTGTTLSGGAPSFDTADSQMAAYWNGRIGETATFTLPNVTLPNTGNLANPGTAMNNAYKAGTIYSLMMQVGEAQFSAADNYSWELNHDVPGELNARLETGDYHDAQNLLLTARISQTVNYNEHGANWYYDGDWKTPATWAYYLAKTNDTAFVSQYFHDDASASSPWGPSLYTIMHSIYQGQLSSDGALAASFDNDSSGRWLFDDYSALQGLAAYKYIATRIGNTAEAQYADTAYTSLLNHVNTLVANNESANGFSYLPCVINQANSGNRCNTYNDANWASPVWVGQNQWSTMLMGGTLNGVIGDPAQSDAMYAWGFARLSANGLPYPTFGAFNGYSTAYNTAYASNGLFGTNYRDLPITSYAWQIATTTGGPNAWWEANGSGPSASNPWIGNHAGPEFGAIPYAWPISAQQEGLLQSIVAEGLSSTGTGPYTYTRPLYIGRGIPNSWIASGQTIGVANLTTSYTVSSGARTTYGVSLAVTKPSTRVVTVTLSGTLPGGAISIQLPIFNTVGVTSVTGGTYNSSTHTVTVTAGATSIAITLAS